MNQINIENFKFTIEKIKDGYVFEKFALSFLTGVLGYDFLPVGGTKDKGIDGLYHTFFRKGFKKQIYQLSTEKNAEQKINDTIDKLRKNDIVYDSLKYVTNRVINNKDKLIDKTFDIYKKPIIIYDQKWFVSNANYNNATINAYEIFIKSHVYEIANPSKTIVVSNLDIDPRLFVFLRQQVEEKRDTFKFDEVLADTLILYILEGTDPDKDIFKNASEIKDEIKEYIKFDPKIINSIINKRLKFLSEKPRKIRHHTKEDTYCLPYETRRIIQERNIEDQRLYETFFSQTEKKLKIYLKDKNVSIKDAYQLICEVIHQIYYQQGLEFSNFILHGESEHVIEKDLHEIISITVDESPVIDKNKESVKVSILMTIRDIVYNGTSEQKKYLEKLSYSYILMFSLHWDPKIATYFESLASNLNIYVGNSIIIPALSEFYLKQENRRHWNLLKASKSAGINMIINDSIIKELMLHIENIAYKYEKFFQREEELYLSEEFNTMYIDDILLRSYFYARSRNQVANFYDYLNNFISPDLKTIKIDLINYLHNEFNIKYLSNDINNEYIDDSEKEILINELTTLKGHRKSAEYDAELILKIYGIREKNNEDSDSSIFGYKTWWLSKDTKTYEIVNNLFKEKYPIGCYMRPDFLYNYIVLSPKRTEVDDAFKNIFSSMIGVNLGFHLPKEVTSFIQMMIKDHKLKSSNPARLKAILRRLSERLKSDPSIRNKKYVKHFFKEELGDVNKINK